MFYFGLLDLFCSCELILFLLLTGDGMNAYMAYKVSTQVIFSLFNHTVHTNTQYGTQSKPDHFLIVPQTSLTMFRSKTFTVRRRFSDFLGLYEKLSEKHSQNGYIVPPPPEKSILGKNLLC